PGVLESLGSAKKKLAIFTGRGRELTLYILKQKKLLKYFEIIVTSEDVENHKPYPDGVLKICGHFNLHPSAVLHIGDSPLDIACGKKAGVITGAALWGCKDKMALEEAKPDYIFHHPKDIERIIL
ncbi:HAD-IA family hydrolase, partial [SCandidatus Aminicenantes bacterium Aminicenantia_JdfR_composite]|nr:HAD-IA family hydrolase [SCandidatus Aminicenantes bacterium Aminicenantia_JdfR_composite]